MNQIKKITFLLFIISFSIVSCHKEDPISGETPEPEDNDQTVLVYLPWSTNLTGYFYNNISDMEKAIAQNILKNERVLVFFHTSPTEASLFELVYKNGECIQNPLKSYIDPPYTTAMGITSIWNDVKNFAPAKRYAMVINCHGMGWIPSTKTDLRSSDEKEYWEYEGRPLTRWFGGLTGEYQTDITTLAEGIAGAGITMEYILFDDCYMSSLEAAYDLKDVAGYLIASPCEVLAHGMPYDLIGQYLFGDVDYLGICNAYIHFYNNYTYPYGTIGVTNCAELENMASVMKEINEKFTFDPSLLNSIQRMDGYSPVRFYDFGDYVTKLCTDPDLLAKFETQLERTVPSKYRMHTEYFYTMSRGPIKINTYTGVTISDPSTSPQTALKTETSWYKATH